MEPCNSDLSGPMPSAAAPFALSALARAAVQAALATPTSTTSSPSKQSSSTSHRATSNQKPSPEAIAQLCAKVAKLCRGAGDEQISAAVHSASFNLSRAVEALRADVERAAEDRKKEARRQRLQRQQSSSRAAAPTPQLDTPSNGRTQVVASDALPPLDVAKHSASQPTSTPWFQTTTSRPRKRLCPEVPSGASPLILPQSSARGTQGGIIGTHAEPTAPSAVCSSRPSSRPPCAQMGADEPQTLLSQPMEFEELADTQPDEGMSEETSKDVQQPQPPVMTIG